MFVIKLFSLHRAALALFYFAFNLYAHQATDFILALLSSYHVATSFHL